MVGKAWIEIADVAQVIVEGPENFCPQAQVQREIASNLPVILRKKSGVVGAVLVVEHPAAPETELRRAKKKVLKVSGRCRKHTSCGGIGEENLAVEDLRKEFVEIHARILAAEAENVLALHPAQGVHEVVVVLRLKLVREGRRADLKSRAGKDKFINGFGHAIGWPVDSEIADGYGWDVDQVVVDVNKSKTKFIYKRRRE